MELTRHELNIIVVSLGHYRDTVVARTIYNRMVTSDEMNALLDRLIVERELARG